MRNLSPIVEIQPFNVAMRLRLNARVRIAMAIGKPSNYVVIWVDNTMIGII